MPMGSWECFQLVLYIIIIIIVVVVVVVIIIIFVSFMQGIHTHIPKTNHVPRGYIVAAILSLLFMAPLFLLPALALLFFCVSTFGSMCAVPKIIIIIIMFGITSSHWSLKSHNSQHAYVKVRVIE